MTLHVTPIDGAFTGTRHELVVESFGGTRPGPVVHVQAGLHADEVPGMLCAVHLARHLRDLEAEDRIVGRVDVIRVANPIGLAQFLLGQPLGRFAFEDGGNFNRGFPDPVDAVAEAVAGRLTDDADENVRQIRAALVGAIAAVPALRPVDRLKRELALRAVAADLVLDLHCDAEAVVHLYTLTQLADVFRPLGAELGARAILTAELSGGDPFDELVSRPFLELARRFPERPIPLAGRSVTVELRGQADVSPALAEADAAAIVRFLTRFGALEGELLPPPPELCEPTPLACSEPLTADRAGILSYRAEVGDVLDVGDPVAEITDPSDGSVTVVRSSSRGVFYARAATRFAHPGKRLGKIAGREVRRTGRLLSP